VNNEPSRRDKLLAVVFVFSTLVVGVFLLDRVRKNPQFWVCVLLSLSTFAASRRKVVLVVALFLFAATRFALALVLRPRWEAVVGLIVCGAITAWLIRTFPDG
jgi:hypothetical protein